MSHHRTYYRHQNFGTINFTDDITDNVSNLSQQIQEITDVINVSEETVHIGYNEENTNVILGNGESGTTTTIKTENLNVGRYIYVHSNNDYSGATDAGLVLNIQEDGDPVSVDGSGFTSTTVEVDQDSGYMPAQIIAVQSALNTGLYQVQSHSSGVITIDTTPDEPFLKTSFNVESANGNIHAVNVQVIRANSDGESEFAHGTFAPLEYNKYLYDTKETGELGQLTLSSGDDQLVFNTGEILSKATTITVEEPTEDRTHTIPAVDDDDEFTLNIAAQTLQNKTMTNKNNNVLARGLFVNNGDASVSTYASTTPSTNQFLKATASNTASFADVKLSAGNSIQLNGSKSEANLGAGTVSISVKLDEEQDPEEVEDKVKNPTEPTDPFPGVDPEIPDVPSIPSMAGGGAAGAVGGAAAVVAVAVGIAVAVGFAGAVGAFGAVATNKIEDTDGNEVVTFQDGNATFKNDVTIEGDLTVLGTTTVSSSNIALDSPYIYLNSNDNVNSAKSTGMIATRYPASTVYSLTNWVAGDGGTDAQCECSSSSGLVVGDFLEVYSTDLAYSGSNAGYYEVYSLTTGPPHILKLKGTLHPNLQKFTKTNVETDNTTLSLEGVKVQLSGLEFGNDAIPRYIAGDNTTTMIKEAVAYDGSSPSFNVTETNELILNSVAESEEDKILCLNGSDEVKYRTIDSITDSVSGAMISTSIQTNNIHEEADTVQFNIILNNGYVMLRVNPFEFTMPTTANYISLGDSNYYNQYFPTHTIIYLRINAVWEQCLLYLSTSSELYITRMTGSNFLENDVIRYGLDDYVRVDQKMIAQLIFHDN